MSSEEECETIAEVEMEGVIFTLTLSQDGVKLFLQADVQPSETKPKIVRLHLLDTLEHYIDISVVNVQVIDDILKFVNAGKSTKRRRIAKGSGAIQGKDGRVDYLVDLFDVDSGEYDSDFLDPRFIKVHDPIKPRNVVARVYNPSTGQDGVDVFGDAVVVEEGQHVDVQFDNTLELQDPPDGSTQFKLLVSRARGYLAKENGVLGVRDTLFVRGDVDVGTGNIHHYADVEIYGGVMKEYAVKAEGDIIVRGNVIAGSVVSLTGNVIVHGSIAGLDVRGSGTNQKAKIFDFISDESLPRIIAAGDVSCKSARDSHIEAGHNVYVEQELFSSLVRASGAVLLQQGHLLGGEIFAVEGVEAGIIGSDGEAKTSIFLCSDIESTTEFATVVSKIGQYERAIEDVRLHLGPYAEEEIDEKLLPAQKEKIATLKERHDEFQKQYAALTERRAEMMSVATFNPEARISVNKKLWASTSICAKDVNHTVFDSLNGPLSLACSLEEETFKQIDFKPLS